MLGCGPGAKIWLETAVTLAVSVCDYLLRQGHAVRLLTPADTDDPAPPAAGMVQMPRILETLVRAEADSPLSLADTVARTRLRTSAGTMFVYITPEADEPGLAAALQATSRPGSHVFGLALQAVPRGPPGPTPESGVVCPWGAAKTCCGCWRDKIWRRFPPDAGEREIQPAAVLERPGGDAVRRADGDVYR